MRFSLCSWRLLAAGAVVVLQACGGEMIDGAAAGWAPMGTANDCPAAAPAGVESRLALFDARLDGMVGRLDNYDSRACDRAGFMIGDLLEVHTVVTGEKGPGMAIVRIPDAFERADLEPGMTTTLTPDDEVLVRGCSNLAENGQWAVDDMASETTVTVREGAMGTRIYDYEARFPATVDAPERTLSGSFQLLPPR